MARIGIVKYFCQEKGYGFIVDVESHCDVFVHHSALRRQLPIKYTLSRGEYVQFVGQACSRGTSAAEVTGPRGGPLYCEIEAGLFPQSSKQSSKSVEPWSEANDNSEHLGCGDVQAHA
jgi:cold shock CspA family protein